jgi:hypothetical protein
VPLEDLFGPPPPPSGGTTVPAGTQGGSF